MGAVLLVSFQNVAVADEVTAAEPRAQGEWVLRARPKHYLRAALEDVGVLGVGIAAYWVFKDLSIDDWDMPSFQDRVSSRGYRFDNNRFATNGLLHPLTGATLYGLPRVNGLTVPEATAYDVASSLLWEFPIEYREKFSLNDLVFNLVGGVSMGEVLFQLGEYVNSAPRGGRWPHRAAAATVGFPRFLHAWADGESPAADGPTDALGFSDAYWHRFEVATGPSVTTTEGGDSAWYQTVRVDSRLAALPGFQREGEANVFFFDGNLTEMQVRVEIGADGPAEIDFTTGAVLFGLWSQSAATHGRRRGVGVLTGLGTAVRYMDRVMVGRKDQFAAAHIAGPEIELWSGFGDFDLRIRASAYPDFVAIRTLALSEWSESGDATAVRSVVADKGYYYGAGGSVRVRAELEYHGLQIGGSGSYGTYESIDGLDRHQEDANGDVPLSDAIGEASAWVGMGPRSLPLHVQVQSDWLFRRSVMGDAEHSARERRLSALVGVRF